MQSPLLYMDPFFGIGTIDLPEPQGIAATWFFIKAQTGNNHPGACAPFGMISACAYSGAYVTGYGLNAPNTNSTPAQYRDQLVASGFTHLQQSGTGAIDTYYNYIRVTPLTGDLNQLGTQWPIEDEVASPGYYAATLKGTGIRAELTASPRAALHRYTFAAGSQARIAIDFSNGGIDFSRMRTLPTDTDIALTAPNVVQGSVTMAGMELYVYVETDTPRGTSALWMDKRELAGSRSLTLADIDADEFRPFGVLFDVPVDQRVVHARVGFSLRSVEQASANVQTIVGKSFAQVRQETERLWETCASRIQVEGGTETQREIFYSSLYHSLIKPADWRGESPYWGADAFYVDFATMWDQYKTQLPLLLTLYPERGADIVNTLISLADLTGGFPNGFVLNANLDQFSNQARALAHNAILDAYYRANGMFDCIDGIDWQRALDAMVRDLRQPRNADFFEKGLVFPVTHTLDLANGCYCTAQLAKALGADDVYDEMMRYAANWRNVYDPGTAKLIEAKYYEGGLWNYSFRLSHDMAGRIDLYPSEAAFAADLDRFFGYGQPPIVPPTDPADRDYMAWGHALNRFEGYNNEPDIETPYGYIYAGRPDRTAEVVRAGMQYMFTTGRGGLPGNNDSGGLTSCYVWNAVGLFPVTGQPVILIGSPIFDAATLQIGDKTFTVEAPGTSDENIYVQSAALDGHPIDRAYIIVDELLAGGTLTLTMGPQPSTWAQNTRPPSYPSV